MPANAEKTINVVVDTNVFVVARFRQKGATKRLIHDCIDGMVQALYNRRMKEEAYRILPKVGASAAFMERLGQYFTAAIEIEDELRLKVCSDPADDMFFECAVSGNADYIITDDADLHDIDGYEGIKVRTASQFYQENNIPKKR